MVSTEAATQVEARRERTVGPRGSSEMWPQMVVEQGRVGGNLSGTSNSTLFWLTTDGSQEQTKCEGGEG